jgi:hypothetical protein
LISARTATPQIVIPRGDAVRSMAVPYANGQQFTVGEPKAKELLKTGKVS